MPNVKRTLLVILFAVALALPATASASRNLYLANGDNGTKGQALVYSLGADGTPSHIQTVTGTAASGYWNAVSMSPNGKALFMADYTDNKVVAYAVAADGTLTQATDSPKSLNPASGPYGSAVTPDGKWLVVGDYDRGGVEVLRIGADATTTQVQGGFLQVAPTAAPYGVAVSTDSRFIYVPDYVTDKVYGVAIGADGALSAVPGSPFPSPANADPYEAAVTPDGKYLYVPNANTNDVSGYAIGADGSLTPLAGSPYPVFTDSYGGLQISPDGKYMYSSGSAEAIEVAGIAADGSLAVANPPTPNGDYNPGLAITPDGEHLYNASGGGGATDELLTYSVDGIGALTAVGTPLALPATTSLDSQSLVVSPNQPPLAAVTATSGTDNAVTFDAAASTDSDGTVASYAWDFGDGQKETTTVPTTTHTYSAAGTYTVTVTLTDNEGCSTASVYTGQTSLCNGSAVATATTSATAVAREILAPNVSAKKTQKQKGKKIAIKVKAGAGEKVTATATGSIKAKGLKAQKLKPKTTTVEANATKTLKIGLKSKKANKSVFKAIEARKKPKAKITVKLTDEAGNFVNQKVSVKLK